MLIMAIDDDNAGIFHVFEMWIGKNEFDHCILDHHMCGKNIIVTNTFILNFFILSKKHNT